MPSMQLYHGDCLEIMPTLAPGSVAMVFADLPYGVTNARKTWDKRISLGAIWAEVHRVCGPNAVQLFTATQPYATHILMSNLERFRHDLIWHKRPTGAVNAKLRQMRAHEHVLVFGLSSSTYNAQMVLRDKPRRVGVKNGRASNYDEPNRFAMQARVLTHKYPTSVFFCVQDNTGLHPTQKPLALLEWLISTYTNPGDTVLDPCFGSNTTGVACKRLGRAYIGIEKDKVYFQAGKARMEAEPWPCAS